MHWYEMKLSGRGQTNSGVSQVCRPERVSDIAKYLEQVGRNGIIARGSAGSYADQTLNAGGAVMLTKRLDCIRSFDAAPLFCLVALVVVDDEMEVLAVNGYVKYQVFRLHFLDSNKALML